MIKSHTPFPRRGTQRHGAFTLVEVLVAVAIMSLLFAVILVPLRLGFDTFHIGTARSEVQQQAQLTVQQIGNDLRRAQFVFPNSRMEGITVNPDLTSPCSLAGYKNTASWAGRPYVRTTLPTNNGSTLFNTSTAAYGVCDSSNIRSWDNPSRIDMLLLRRDRNGAPVNSNEGEDYLITYYPRRLDITKPYDVIDNPVVLWRAQYAFRGRQDVNLTTGTNGEPENFYKPGSTYSNGLFFNANIDWTQYPDTIGSCTTQKNRDFLWITHNFYGEANLEPLTGLDTQTPAFPKAKNVEDAHTLATPRGMELVVPRTNTNVEEGLLPELSFVQEATDGNRINRVTINLTLAQYDRSGEGKAQRVRVSRTIDLPSAGCSP
ncbi:MAG: prepilin-type N-terminal cleavage/methylation domain-containing protein [Armatimonadetes bacterium]|nr:prepilin-type N-terminal cleavage/methylation domain-containing protein [Armatimonadota bacterium]